MAMKSDFAQKLLRDLRLRKERMAAARSSNASGASTDAYGSTGQTFRGSAQLTAPDYIGRKAANSNQQQIVSYGRGRVVDQKSDLSMAFSLAFGNGSKMDITGSNAMIKLLNQIGRRPSDKETKMSSDICRSSNRSPAFASIHITEVSKGVQKLQQIIRASPNGLHFDGCSIEAGKELLKGAMDLEESLRMLVNLQEESERISSAQRKTKIRLLDEEEEEVADESKAIKQADRKQVDRPRFSFDKPSKNSQGTKESANSYIKKHLMALTHSDETPKSNKKESLATSNVVHHKRSVSCVPAFRATPTTSEPQNPLNSSFPKQEKGRISNVVAKLMGLEEVPQREDKNPTQKELSLIRKDGAETRIGDTGSRTCTTTDKRMLQPNSVPPLSEGRSVLESSKMIAVPHGGSARTTSYEYRASTKLEATVKKHAAFCPEMSGMTKRVHHRINLPAQSSGYYSDFQGQGREARGSLTKEKNIREISESQKQLLLKELQHQIPRKHSRLQADSASQEDAKRKAKVPEREMKYTGRTGAGKQQQLQGNREIQRLKRLKDIKGREEKSQVERREQNLARQKLPAGGCKESPAEPINLPKSRNLSRSPQKEGPYLVQKVENKNKFQGPSDAMPSTDLPHNRYHEKYVQQETSRQVSVTQKKTDIAEVFLTETPDKSDAIENCRGNGNIQSLTEPNNQTPALKVIRKTSVIEEGAELLKHQQRETEVAADLFNKSKIEVQNNTDGLQIEAKGNSCILEDKAPLRETPEILLRNDKLIEFPSTVILMQQCKDPAMEVCALSHDHCYGGQPAVSSDIEIKPENALINQESGTSEENMKTNNVLCAQKKTNFQGRTEEVLKESEEHLKQKLTKSVPILKTVEALFKLNIPIGDFHGGDDKVKEDTENKLTLDCAYEVLLRKGRKHELRTYPCSAMSNHVMFISSFEELIKQLCKDLDTLKLYGGIESGASDAADLLQSMIEKDIQSGLSDASSMWDHGWHQKAFAFVEKDDIIKGVEKHLLNGLLDEVTLELLHSSTVLASLST